MTAKRKRAGPVAKSDAVVKRILAAVSNGKPLVHVCRASWAPNPSTFYRWVDEDPLLQRDFARARELGHDAIAADIREIARGGRGSSKDTKRDRLIADVDIRLLEKWDKRYSPRNVLAGDPEAPLFPAATNDQELACELLTILGDLARRAGQDLQFNDEQMIMLEPIRVEQAKVEEKRKQRLQQGLEASAKRLPPPADVGDLI